jgi:hypothetical protein
MRPAVYRTQNYIVISAEQRRVLPDIQRRKPRMPAAGNKEHNRVYGPDSLQDLIRQSFSGSSVIGERSRPKQTEGFKRFMEHYGMDLHFAILHPGMKKEMLRTK